MHPELSNMIARFRASQDLAVEVLVSRLGIPLPESAIGWVMFCRKERLHEVNELQCVPFNAHGFGVAVEIDGVKVDFDWGDDGQPDGFDGWRLWWHYMQNDVPPPGSHSDVCEWLESAYADGELEKQRSLYYDPSRRAICKK
jgi:hypothetical protein